MSRAVSVLIPVFNAEADIHDCLQGIFNDHLDKEFRCELVIIDDGSVDASAEVIDGIILPPQYTLKVIKNNVNKGITYSLRKGLDSCSGNYIFRMDVDDRWVIGRFDKQIQFMEENPHIFLSGGAMRGLSSDKLYLPLQIAHLKLSDFMISSPVFHPTFCFRNTKSLRQMYNVESPFDDLHSLLSLLLTDHNIANISDVLIGYNDSVHQSRLSIRYKHSREIKFFVLRKYLAWALFKKNVLQTVDIREIIRRTALIMSCSVRDSYITRVLGFGCFLINSAIYKIFRKKR
jgi:glycosyltransferase involved in cell wall biosynthesis